MNTTNCGVRVSSSLIIKATKEIEMEETLREIPEYWGISSIRKTVTKRRTDPMQALRRKVYRIEKALGSIFDDMISGVDDIADLFSPSGQELLHVEN